MMYDWMKDIMEEKLKETFGEKNFMRSRKVVMLIYSVFMFMVYIWIAFKVYDRIGFEKAIIIYMTVMLMLLKYNLWNKHDVQRKKLLEKKR